jgi:hypothetical protein
VFLTNAVNADVFFVRCANYKCADYGRRSIVAPE